MHESTSDKGKSGNSDSIVSHLGAQVRGLDHIAIAVVNLNDAIEWYTKMLGFRLTEMKTTRGDKTGMVWAVMKAGSAVVVLIQGTEPESQVSRFVEKFGPGVQHLALEVYDLSHAVDSVVAAGGEADSPIFNDIGIRQIFLRRESGSGVRIELIERRGGNFSNHTVESLFRQFEYQDLY